MNALVVIALLGLAAYANAGVVAGLGYAGLGYAGVPTTVDVTGPIAAAQGAVAAHQGQVAGLQGHYAAAQGVVAAQQGQVAAAQGAYAGLQGQYAAAQGVVAAQQGQVAAAQGQYAAIQGQAAAVQGRLTHAGVVGYAATPIAAHVAAPALHYSAGLPIAHAGLGAYGYGVHGLGLNYGLGLNTLAAHKYII